MNDGIDIDGQAFADSRRQAQARLSQISRNQFHPTARVVRDSSSREGGGDSALGGYAVFWAGEAENTCIGAAKEFRQQRAAEKSGGAGKKDRFARAAPQGRAVPPDRIFEADIPSQR